MRQRRILYLITSDISARFLRGQLGYLIENGYQVSVGTRLSEPSATFDDGVVVHDAPYVRDPSPVADIRALSATVRLVRSIRPGIVNASTPKAGLLGMFAAWLCRVPRRIYVVRGLRFETTTGVRRKILRLLERTATSAATDVIYNSRSLLSLAEREGVVAHGRGIVLGAGSGNGIDVSRFEDLPDRDQARAALGVDPAARVIGFVGRLTHDKGIVDLLTAFGDDSSVTLLIVGDFEAGDPVPAATRRALQAAPNVVHVSWIDDTRIAYAAMDVLAFPSYREGLPNVPLEAQLCGVPVVAYAGTGTVDAVAHGIGGALVPVGDAERLRCHAIAELDTPPDEVRRAEMADWVGRNFDRRLVWHELVKTYGG